MSPAESLGSDYMHDSPRHVFFSIESFEFSILVDCTFISRLTWWSVIRWNEADTECTGTLRTKSDLLKINSLVKNIVNGRFDEFCGTILLTQDVKDLSYHAWIRGVAWPRVAHESQSIKNEKCYWIQRVLSAIISNRWFRKTKFPILHELYNNYDK